MIFLNENIKPMLYIYWKHGEIYNQKSCRMTWVFFLNIQGIGWPAIKDC